MSPGITMTMAPPPAVEVIQKVPPVGKAVAHGTPTLVSQAFANMDGLPVDLSQEGHDLDDKGSFEDVWNHPDYND